MKLLTASALERAEKCPPSQSLPWAREEHEAGHRGTALHAYCVTAAVKGREAALAECPEEWRTEAAAIDVTALPHSSGGYSFEVAFAYDADGDTALELGRDVGREAYAGLDAERYTGGTADLVGVSADDVVVLDLKTGRRWLPEPRASLQLQLLALAATRVYRRARAVVGWIRLVDTVPRLVVESLGPWELEEARERLQALRARVRKFAFLEQKPEAKVALAVGEWCRYCPAIRACWAHTSALPPEGTLPDPLTHVEHLERMADLARKQLDAQARNTPVPLPDGRAYGPRTQLRRSIDAGKALPLLLARHPGLDTTKLTTVTAAALKRLGLDSETEMAALAAAGAVTTTEVEVMEAQKQ